MIVAIFFFATIQMSSQMSVRNGRLVAIVHDNSRCPMSKPSYSRRSHGVMSRARRLTPALSLLARCRRRQKRDGMEGSGLPFPCRARSKNHPSRGLDADSDIEHDD